MISFLKAVAVTLAIAATSLTAIAQERPSTILVLDASGSMWGQINGENKIVIARKVVADILSDFPKDQNLGFVTYGHRERGQCSDIQTMIEPAPDTAGQIISIVNELNPRGMTPMTDAVITAATALRHTEQAATVILVSDGIETCNPDPCAAARALKQSGIDFTAHVIGFDVKGEADARKQMQCIADETGGQFLTADNAQELSEALQQVVAPSLPDPVEITMIAVIGSEAGAQVDTPVTWIVNTQDGDIEIDGNPGVVKLLPGQWNLTAYHTAQEREQFEQIVVTDGSPQTLRVVFSEPTPEPANATVSAPPQVVVGSSFTVTWIAENTDPQDYVTIVPAGAKEGSYGDYARVGNDKSEASLRAPAGPGLYEVRLQTAGSGSTVLATTPIEVLDADVTVTAPTQALVGASFTVNWDAPGLHPQDYVTIVPEGAKEGSYTDYQRIGDKSEGSLRAPAEPGFYEVRFQLAGNGRVLASTPIEVMEGNVTVRGPEKVRAGSKMALTWTGAIHSDDYVTIVPAGTEDGKYAAYTRVGKGSEGSLPAPEQPGLYELRYHLQQGTRIMARQAVEVVAADAPLDDGAGLVVPRSGKSGEIITISWTGGTDSADQRVTLARADQADFSWVIAENANGRNDLSMTLPTAPGTYEVRFLDVTNRSVLGRSMLEVQP